MNEARHLSATEIERRLLAALCSTALGHKTRAGILECLATHKFANPDHEVIFQAIVKMPPASGEHIRETLAARLTRLGFPDIDVEPIFELPPDSTEKIAVLMRQLSR